MVIFYSYGAVYQRVLEDAGKMNRMLIGLKMSEYVGTAGTVSEKDLIRAIPWKNSWLNIWNHQPVVPYITICWTILDIEIIGHVFCPSKKNPTVYIPSLYPILSQYCWLFIYSIYECAYYIYIHTYIPLKLLRRSHIYIFYIYIYPLKFDRPWLLIRPPVATQTFGMAQLGAAGLASIPWREWVYAISVYP